MRAGMIDRHDFSEQWLPLCGAAPVLVVLLGLDPAVFAQTEQIFEALANGERALTAPYRTADLVWLDIASLSCSETISASGGFVMEASKGQATSAIASVSYPY
jgi:hypothetical protein